SPNESLASLLSFKPRLLAELRASGISLSEAGKIVEEAYKVTLRAAVEPIGRWILAPHKNAASEVRWTGLLSGELRQVQLRQVQVDGLFKGGNKPLSRADEPAEPVWWIIDYKSGASTETLTSEQL